MGLTVDTPFFYQNRETRREREAHQHVSHCVGKDATLTRIRKRSTAVSDARRSAATGRRSRKARSGSPSPAHSRSSAPRSGSCKSSPPSSKGDGHSGASRSSRATADSRPLSDVERCYERPARVPRAKCAKPARWQNGVYRRDECGSGIEPVRMSFVPTRKKLWCKTPLSMYQATIGELGRAILCREKIVPRDVKPGPPCNVEEYILPPCRGYYRKYDCVRPCEEMYAIQKAGHKVYRDRVERYWEPCMTRQQNGRPNVNEFAGQNVFLGAQLRRNNQRIPCW